MTLQEGHTVGVYRIVTLLGRGGMGEVYRARDPRLGRDVAIKVMAPSHRDDPDRLRRFRDEIRAAGALDHPNVLVVHDVGEQEGIPYLVSELLDGVTLRARLGAGRLDRSTALPIARQVAEGLAAIHRAGVVHRDLKPANIMILEDGRAKILDFGIARPIERGDATGTRTGAILGSTAYMAPEQVRGDHVDQRADLFAFGIVLHEMMSGTRPFDAESEVELGYAILKKEPAPLDDEGIEAIVRRCLAKDPADRYQSAHDLAFAIEALEASTRPTPRRLARTARIIAIAVITAGLGGGAYGVSRGAAKDPIRARHSRFRPSRRLLGPVSSGHGVVGAARFDRRGEVVYSASWNGESPRLYAGDLEGSELARGVDLLATTSDGSLALLTSSRLDDGVRVGGLARGHVHEPVVRSLGEEVVAADWLPDGELAISRWVAARTGDAPGTRHHGTVEWPLGREIYRTDDRPITDVRVSPDGGQIALLERDRGGGNGGDLVVLDRLLPPRRILHAENIRGLGWAWGDSALVTAFEVRPQGFRCIQIVHLSGTAQVAKCATGDLAYEDWSPPRGMLVTLTSPTGDGTGETSELFVVR